MLCSGRLAAAAASLLLAGAFFVVTRTDAGAATTTAGCQDAELAVLQAGDQATSPADANAVRRLIALGFQRELDRDWIVSRTAFI